MEEGEFKELENYAAKASPQASPQTSPLRTKRKSVKASTDRTGMVKRQLDKAIHVRKEVQSCLKGVAVVN
jgi:hypothetical protein